MKNNFFCIILLSFFLYACSYDAEYIHDRYSPIPDSLQLFFPKYGSEERHLLLWKQTCATRGFSGDSDKITPADLPVEITCNNYPTLIKVYKIKHSKKNLIALKNHYANIALFTMKAANATPMLWDFDDVLAIDERSKLYLDSIYHKADGKTLVPDFNEDFDWRDKWTGTSSCGLSEDFELYVLKMGETFVLPRKWNVYRSWLPGKFQHGYRSGVAINARYIIYWCMAW